MTAPSKKFTISRTLKADKQTVFNAFSNAESLAAWWGPVGMPATVLAFDFQPEGKFHYKIEGNGKTMWGIFAYKKIMPTDLIEYVSSFSDADGNICQDPFGINFPLQVFNQVTFEEQNGETVLTLSGYALDATEEQKATYEGMFAGMNQGFTGTLNQLEAFLAK